MKLSSFARQFDWVLFLAVFLLLALGLSVQYSLSANLQGAGISNFARQAVFAGLGLVLFFLISFLDYRLLKTYAYPLYFFILALLVAVLAFGKVFHGTKGWFSFGSFNFQVVELVKVILIIVMAKYWSKCAAKRVWMSQIFFSAILMAVPAGLILLQPDMGSALLLVGLWLAILAVIDRQLGHLALVLLLIAAVITFSWFFVLKDYQKSRIMTFVNPQRDYLGQGYQIIQSVVAVGSGKFSGRGLGSGTQSQLRFLPASETDFVFAVIAEELGFLGVSFLLGLFIFLFYRLTKIARLAYDDFSLFLILGIMGMFFIQIFINVGMNIGLAPIMGIPLPLISYGGSSLVTSLLALGIAESIAIHGVKSRKTT